MESTLYLSVQDYYRDQVSYIPPVLRGEAKMDSRSEVILELLTRMFSLGLKPDVAHKMINWEDPYALRKEEKEEEREEIRPKGNPKHPFDVRLMNGMFWKPYKEAWICECLGPTENCDECPDQDTEACRECRR